MLWAAARGEIETLQSLVESGASIVKPRKDGVTVLHLAATNNDIPVLNYALRAKRAQNVDYVSDDVCITCYYQYLLGVDTSSSCRS